MGRQVPTFLRHAECSVFLVSSFRHFFSEVWACNKGKDSASKKYGVTALLCIWVCDSPCLQRLHSNAVPTNKYHGNPVCSRGAGEVGEHQITKWHWLFKCHYIKIELLERAGPCQPFSSWLWHLCYFACICLCDKQGVSVFIMPSCPPPPLSPLFSSSFCF